MKSVFGLSENIAAALSYIFGPFSGIVVLVMEKENKFVRFHALQSIIWFLFLMIGGWVLQFLSAILGSIPIVGILLSLVISPVLWIGGIVYWVSKAYLVFKAIQGATYKIPVVGDVVWTQVNG